MLFFEFQVPSNFCSSLLFNLAFVFIILLSFNISYLYTSPLFLFYWLSFFKRFSNAV